jgi:long-subunit fatty acid transport protein
MLNGNNLSWGKRGPALRTLAYLGLLVPALSAQSLSLPASDPVGIGRAGVGVAFGRSLEAASLNPALLTTLLETRSAYLGLGEEFQSSQVTLQSNRLTDYSTDRNRFVPSFGVAWRLKGRTMLGLKVDVPFLRHGLLPASSSARFLGDEISLKTLRAEVQLAGSFGKEDQVSLGASLGAMKVDLTQGTVVRARVGGTDPTQAVSAANPSLGLVETRISQQGSATVGTYGFGFRWALSPRWTLGAAAQGFLKSTLHPDAEMGSRTPTFVDNDGFSTPALGLNSKGMLMLAASTAQGGSGRIALPGLFTLGVRHRLNNLLTWEADLRYVQASTLELPSSPSLATPSGAVASPGSPIAARNTLALLVGSELTLTKRWTLRGGFSLDQGFRREGEVEPLLGGSRTSGFALGAGLKAWGGEWNLGYSVWFAKDEENANLQGAWSSSGYQSSHGLTRVEGMGHLLSIGFRKSF